MSEKLLDSLPPDWSKILKKYLSQENLEVLENLQFFLETQETKKAIFPPKNQRFNAFKICPYKKVKVVILGQDPYHGEEQAMGLSFSVPKDLKLPPSLKNIFKELEDDLNLTAPENGDLTFWAEQGVLLLNTVLTVEKAKAGSHQKKGWEILTQAVLRALNDQENLVFILWGNPAQKSAQFIQEDKHKILKSVHPSPLSAYRGFFGSKPFSQCNQYLKEIGKSPINWT